MTDWARTYVLCNQDMVRLARSLTAEQAATVVPATPAWTVRDLLAHQAGGASDLVHDRMDDAPSPAWTARHVRDRRDASSADLVDELERTQQRVVDLQSQLDRPAFVWDRSVHLTDLHEALGLGRPPSDRWHDVLVAVEPMLADLPPTDPYERFRAAFSRRSQRQLRLLWPDAPDARLAEVGIFGPRDDDQPIPSA